MSQPLEPMELGTEDYVLAFRQAHTLVRRRPAWFAVMTVVILLTLAVIGTSETLAVLMPAVQSALFFVVLILARDADESLPHPVQGIQTGLARGARPVLLTCGVCAAAGFFQAQYAIVGSAHPRLFSLLPGASLIFAGALPDSPAIADYLHIVDAVASVATVVLFGFVYMFEVPLRFLLRQYLNADELDRVWACAEDLNGNRLRLAGGASLALVMILTWLGMSTDLVWLVATYCLLIGPTWWYCVFRMMFTGRRELRAETPVSVGPGAGIADPD